MKLNIAYPRTGAQKLIEIEDDKRYRKFYDLKLAEEISGEMIGDEWKGYILKLTGGNDKQGFQMKQGVLTTERVRLLLKEGDVCYRRYRGQKRKGTRKRKSVRGCIVSAEIAVLAFIIVKKGEQEIPGLTDVEVQNRLGPKRASKIRKLFNLSKKDDVREYVIRRTIPIKQGSKRKKPRTKAPKIQRLVTPRKIQARRRRKAQQVKRRARVAKEVQAYQKLLAKRRKEQMSRRRQLASRKSKKSTKPSKQNAKQSNK